MSRLIHIGPTGDAEDLLIYCSGESNTGLPDDYSLHGRRLAGTLWSGRYDASGTGAASTVNKRSTWRRGWIRVQRLPIIESGIWYNFGTVNAGSAALLLTVMPDGTLNLRNKGAVAFPGDLIGTPGKITAGQWHLLKTACIFNTLVWASNNSFAEVGLDGVFVSGTALSNQGIGVIQLGYQDSLGRLETDFPWMDVDYAHWVVDDAGYPIDSRISSVKVAAVGTFQQWAAAGNADWRARNTWPGIKTALGGATTGIRTATAAQKQTYLMESFAVAGITGTILGAQVHIEFAEAPATVPDLIVIHNGTETDTALWTQANANYMQYRLDVTGWTLSDTIELGIRNNVGSGGTTRIGSIVLSVEHDTPVPPITATTTAAAAVTWTGNATAQSVTIPADATYIWWWPRSNASSGGFWSAEANVAQTVADIGKGDPNFIVRGTQLYLVGAGANGANLSAVVYDALVISDPTMRMVAAGAYAETNAPGRDDKAIAMLDPVGVPFAPLALIAVQEITNTTTFARYFGPGVVGDLSTPLTTVSAASADFIQALTATGFTAGLSLHTDTQQVSYVGFRRTAAINTFLMDAVSYVGNGAGGLRRITVNVSGLVVSWAIGVPLNATDRAIRNDQQAAAKKLGVAGGTLANSLEAFGANYVDVGIALNATGVTYSLLVFAYGIDPGTVTPCTGGGTVVSGTNPGGSPVPPSLETATAPLTWVELTPVGGSTLSFGMSAINYGDPKTGVVKSFGRLKRSLCDGDAGPQASVVTSTYVDTSRTLRALATAGTLKYALIEYFTADLTTLQAGDPPTRRFRGRVTSWRAESGLLFTLTAEDELTARLTSIDAVDVQVPQRLLDTSVTDNNPAEYMFEKPAPEAYGNISDELLATPIGVWECVYTANITVAGYEHLGNVMVFLVMAQVGSAVQALFSADPFSGTPMTVRARVPVLARGDWTTTPGAYWLAPGDTGYPSADFWYTGGNGRYWLIFGQDGHPVVQMAADGRIPLTINFCAYETVGDGTGNTINSPARAFLHWLNNRVVQEATADWLAIAALDDYSLFDTTTFAAVHTLLDALDYEIAGMLGHDFTQRSWRDGVAEWCRNFGFEYGINRHGQVMLTYLDRTDAAAGAPTFTPSHILERGCDVDMKSDAVENEVRYVYARNYLSALQDLNPATGERGLREPSEGLWLSGLVSQDDNASIAALGGDPEGRRRSAVQEYSLVRDDDTADAVGGERLALKSPPNGRAEVTFDLGLREGVVLELGIIATLEHWDVPWTGTRRCQVRQMIDDFDACVITVTVRDVDDLLP